MKISVIVETRPEIIKMSPVIRELKKRGTEYYVLHTGQHYSHNMSALFFEDMELPQLDYKVDTGKGYRGRENKRNNTTRKS